MTLFVTYVVAGFLLNSTITFSFQSHDEKMRKYDEFLAFLIFYPLWPIGLIVFLIKYLQGKADVR